jgi:hypothetical protein
MEGNDIYYLGVLATEEEVQENNIGKSNCFVNKYNTLQFNLKIISRMPGKELDSKYVVGYSNKIYSNEIVDNGAFDEEIRINDYISQLKNYLFGFCCEENPAGYTVAKNIDIVKIDENYFDRDSINKRNFYSIPCISEKTVLHNGIPCKSFEELKSNIKSCDYLCKFNKYDINNTENIPYIIYYDKESKTYKVIGNFTSFTYDNYNGIKFNYAKLKAFAFNDDWYESVFSFSNNTETVFVDSYLHKKIIANMNESEPIDVMENKSEAINEWNFIEHFDTVAKKAGLFYDKKDLINFHTAVKSNTLVILSGLSGTGKSQLVYCYTKALGLDDSEFCVVPVRPSWTDDSDIIGYVDSMHMVYRPSDSGFIDILIRASKEENKDKLYIICLDEMNLARVEHYFSEFLSILELPDKSPDKYRKLKLYSPEYAHRLYNSDKYPQTVNIGSNIRFIGTINVDESTFHFSDKVLDRANVIQLNVVPYTSWPSLKSTAMETSIDSYSYIKYESMVKTENEISLTDREKEFLWKVHNEFRKISHNLGVGPRILKQISKYLINLPDYDNEENIFRKEGFDIQFVQRVLTKFRGSKEQLINLLNPDADNSLYTLINDYSDISDFKKTKETLQIKMQEINIYGYTL